MATLNNQNKPGNRRLKHNGALSATISHSDFPATTSGQDDVAVFAVPANSIITYVRVINKTAWNGTTPELIVGTSSDDDSILTTTQFTPTTGVKSANSGIDTGGSDMLLLAKLTWGASKPTAGETVLVVEFTEYGKNAGAPSAANVAEVAV